MNKLQELEKWKHKNRLWYLILKYPKEWDWDLISKSPTITCDIIQANPEKPWNWYAISRNPNITWDFIQANPEKPWDWNEISRHPNITWDIILSNLEKPWVWAYILLNPNITVELIEAYLNKINYFPLLSDNKLTFIRKKYQQKQCKLVLFTLRDFLPQQLQKTIAMEYLYQKIK